MEDDRALLQSGGIYTDVNLVFKQSCVSQLTKCMIKLFIRNAK